MSEVSTTRDVSVLADPTRAAILNLMLGADDGRVLVGRTSDALGLRQPTVSHHMRALLDAGVVRREPDGRRTWYSISPDQRDRVRALLSPRAEDQHQPSDMARVVADLSLRFQGRLERDVIDRVVHETQDLIAATAPSRQVAPRTAAFAATRLEDLVHPTTVPTVLFVCVKNAGRSQIAAGILRHLAGERVQVRTAGSAPADHVRDSIESCLDEIGIPLSGDFPKPLTQDAVDGAHVIVTMGCGDVCRIRPGILHLDWDIEDPVGQPAAIVRAIRDDIDTRVRGLLRQIDERGHPVFTGR